MSFRHIVIAISCIALFSCNSEKKEIPASANIPPDVVRDGLKGKVKQYIHEEYAARQEGSDWVRANETAIVRNVYTYDTAGNLLEAIDAIQNGKPANTKRVYKQAKDKPLVIIRYEGADAVARTERQWKGTLAYTEKTYRSFDKNDTVNWESLQEVTLNSNNLLDKYTYQLKTGDSMYKASAKVMYNADKSLRSKTIYNSKGDSTVISYTILSKDDKGNPTKILKQNPATNEHVLMVDSYEYY